MCGTLSRYKPDCLHLSHLLNPASKRTSSAMPSPESLKLSPEAWVGGGVVVGGGTLQSMGLTGEPAVAATVSSAGRVCLCVCVWCVLLCVCVCACACVCVCVRE